MPEFPGSLRPPRLPAAPSAPAKGEMYFDNGTNKLMWWDGTKWVDASGGGGAGAAEVNISTVGPSPRAAELLWVDTDDPALPLTVPASAVPLDSWHTVGAAGEPPFGSGWANATSSVSPFQFRKDAFGRVLLRGMVRGGAAGTYVLAIGSLPAGYRPPSDHRFECTVYDGTTIGTAHVIMQANGGIYYLSGASTAAATSYLDLGVIEFDTDTVTSFPTGPQGPQGVQGPKGDAANPTALDTWHLVGAAGEPAFNTNWSSYGGSEEPVAFRKTQDGRVVFRGLLLRSSTQAAAATMAFTLPAGYRPPGFQRFVAYLGSGNLSIGGYVGSDGQLMFFGAVNAAQYVDLSSVEIDTATTTSVLAGPKGDTGAVGPQGPPGDAPTQYTLDGWHLVGGSGEPAFQNGWSNFGGAYATAAFRKMPDGTVRLRGTVKGGTNASVIFTLPVGYRPNATLTPASESYTSSYVDMGLAIGANGSVQHQGSINTQVWLDVSFVAEDVPVTTMLAGPQGDKGADGSAAGTTIEGWHVVGAASEPIFQNNWTSYGGAFMPAGFRKDPEGRVTLRGSIKNGTNGATVFTLPVGYRPTSSVRFTTLGSAASAAAFGVVSIDTAGNVAVNGDSVAMVSIDGVQFDTDTVTTMLAGAQGPAGATGPPWVPSTYTMDTWHSVGAAGEPAFGSGYSNESASNPLQFRKTPDGQVLIRGRVACPATAGVMFTLPVGYRPPQGTYIGFTVLNYSNSTIVYIGIGADGTVNKVTAAATYADMGICEFDTDTVSTLLAGPKGDPGPKGDKGDASAPVAMDNWHTIGAVGEPGFTSGSQYAGFLPVGFRKDPFGRVHLRGLVNAPAATGVIFTLPVGYRPAATVLYDVNANGAGRLDIGTGGTVQCNMAAAPAWLSLDGVYFDTDLQTTLPVGPPGPVGPSGADAYTLPTARVATTADTNLYVAPAQIDGINMVAGDVVLVWLQTNRVQNGLYVWNNTNIPMTRLAPAAQEGRVLAPGVRVYVRQGTAYGNRDFYLTAQATVNTDNIVFTPPKGTMIDFRRIDGLAGDYLTLTAGAWNNLTIHSDGRLCQLVYTPPVDVLWSLDGLCYLTKGDAAYTYTQDDIYLSPADAAGWTTAQEIMSGQYNGVVTYYSHKPHREFQLVAGTTYTAIQRVYLQAGTLTSYRGGSYLWLMGKAFVR